MKKQKRKNDRIEKVWLLIAILWSFFILSAGLAAVFGDLLI